MFLEGTASYYVLGFAVSLMTQKSLNQEPFKKTDSMQS
jgi:hypothetical protein